MMSVHFVLYCNLSHGRVCAVLCVERVNNEAGLSICRPDIKLRICMGESSILNDQPSGGHAISIQSK